MRAPWLAVGIVVGAVAVGGGAVALGAIPDSSGVVHACFQNVTSANKPVKLLDTAKTSACPSGWKPVTWNQKGVPGANGTNGTNGTSGTTIAARARLVSPTPVPSGSPNTPVGLPLTGATWTQPAGHLNQLYADQMSVSVPSTCTLQPGGATDGTVHLVVEVWANGAFAFMGDVSIPSGHAGPVEVNLLPYVPPVNGFNAARNESTILFEPSSPRSDTITADAFNNCLDPGQAVTMNSIAVDVADMH
jgi:hypothetical protein